MNVIYVGNLLSRVKLFWVGFRHMAKSAIIGESQLKFKGGVMSKRLVGISIGMVALIISWFSFAGESSDTTMLYVSPEEGAFVVDVTTTGELKAKNSTKVRAPGALRNHRIYELKIQRLVAEGKIVKKGDFVAELDRSPMLTKIQDAQLEVQKVEAQITQEQLDSSLTLSQARDNLVNLNYTLEEKELVLKESTYESPSVKRQAQIDVDRTKRQLQQDRKNYDTKVKQAEAKISEIEADLVKKRRVLSEIQELMTGFTIYAPDNGMVIYKKSFSGAKTKEGSTISAWDPTVAELPDFSVMQSITYVNEVDIKKVQVGQKVEIGLDSDRDKQLFGTVSDVANVGEQKPGSDSKVFQVIVEVAGIDTTLRPAMTTSNRILVDDVDNAIYVPLESIHTVDSLNFVFKRNGGSTIMQQVKLGLINDNSAIIHEGVNIEDQLYLSLPADTSGIRRNYLQDSLTLKGN